MVILILNTCFMLLSIFVFGFMYTLDDVLIYSIVVDIYFEIFLLFIISLCFINRKKNVKGNLMWIITSAIVSIFIISFPFFLVESMKLAEIGGIGALVLIFGNYIGLYFSFIPFLAVLIAFTIYYLRNTQHKTVFLQLSCCFIVAIIPFIVTMMQNNFEYRALSYGAYANPIAICCFLLLSLYLLDIVTEQKRPFVKNIVKWSAFTMESLMYIVLYFMNLIVCNGERILLTCLIRCLVVVGIEVCLIVRMIKQKRQSKIDDSTNESIDCVDDMSTESIIIN